MPGPQNLTAPPHPRRRRVPWFRKATATLGPPPRYWQTHHWPRGRRPHRAFIVHGKCADGFTSAGLLLNKWPDGMVLFAQPGELLQRLREAASSPPWLELVLADVSPQIQDSEALLEALRELRTHCKITWIDHHAPQWTLQFEERLQKLGIDVVLDRTGRDSGASLVAKWTRTKDKQLLYVADMVRRRDAWTDPHNPLARAWVAVAGALRRQYVERVADVRLEGLEQEGVRLVNQKDRRVDETLRKRVRKHSSLVRWQWGQDDVSDVADRLFRMDPEADVFLRFGTSGNVSIRTRHDRPIAADIAQSFGGGGHGNAAGFHLRLPLTQRLAYRLLRGRDASARTVRQRAHEHAAKLAASRSVARQPVSRA